MNQRLISSAWAGMPVAGEGPAIKPPPTRQPPISRLWAVVLVMLMTGFVSSPRCPAWEIVTLQGRDYVALKDVKESFGFDALGRDGDSVTLQNRAVEMRLKIGQRECFLNNTKFVLSAEIAEDKGKILIPQVDLENILQPVFRTERLEVGANLRVVILDPGHGGKDRGFSNDLGDEAGYTLHLAGELKRLLEKRGFRVILTREEDVTVATEQRVASANQVEEPAVFISLHFSSGPPVERGIRTFRMAPKGVPHFSRAVRKSDFQIRAGNRLDSFNAALAIAVHSTVLLTTGRQDQGVQYARFAELMDLEHPAIRIEGGFLSHPDEARLIHQEAYRKKLAGGIANAIVKFRVATGGKVKRPVPGSP